MVKTAKPKIKCKTDIAGRQLVRSLITGRCVLPQNPTLRKEGQCLPKVVHGRTGRTRTLYFVENPEYVQWKKVHGPKAIGMGPGGKIIYEKFKREFVDGKYDKPAAPRACLRAGGKTAREVHGDQPEMCDLHHQMYKDVRYVVPPSHFHPGGEGIKSRCVIAKKDEKQCQKGQALYEGSHHADETIASYRCMAPERVAKAKGEWTKVRNGYLDPKLYKGSVKKPSETKTNTSTTTKKTKKSKSTTKTKKSKSTTKSKKSKSKKVPAVRRRSERIMRR